MTDTNSVKEAWASWTAGKTKLPFSECKNHWTHHTMADLFKTGAYSDCTIKMKECVFNGHIDILASACEYFDKALCGNFQEGVEKTVDFSEDEPAVVKSMLRFIYGFEYNDIIDAGHIGLFTDVRLYVLADRIDYQCLKVVAADYLCEKVKTLELDYAALSELLFFIEESSSQGDEGLRQIAKAYTKAHVQFIHTFTEEQHASLSLQLPYYAADVIGTTTSPTLRSWGCRSCCSTEFICKKGNAKYCPNCGGSHNIVTTGD